MAPFLKEHDFLQGLGTLVQSHAEEIKAMVMALRARAEASQADETAAPEMRGRLGRAPGDSVSSRSSAGAPRPQRFEPASSGEIGRRASGSSPIRSRCRTSPPVPTKGPWSTRPWSWESATEPDSTTDGSLASDRRERSLRELFWGEE